MCDGDIFQCDVELCCTAKEIGSYPIGDGLTLCDEFCCVELCDDCLEDFVADGRQDTLVIVLTKVL